MNRDRSNHPEWLRREAEAIERRKFRYFIASIALLVIAVLLFGTALVLFVNEMDRHASTAESELPVAP